ncbi:MAG TPA: hypothetical protein VFJ16_21550 [Longimicrobium sp.]|nr:hypothetical protein [Longimicrobium sp.]
MSPAVVELTSLISLGLLWLMGCWLYRDYRIDRFRHNLFRIRDELFDWAGHGGIEFSHPAYGVVRTTLNGFIRFAEDLSFTSLIIASSLDVDDDVVQIKLESAFEGLTHEQQMKLYGAWTKMHREVAEQVILRSPLLLLVVVPMIIVVALRQLSARVIRRLLLPGVVRAMRRLDVMAFTYGDTGALNVSPA